VSLTLLVPLLGAIVAGSFAAAIQRRLPPRRAVLILTVTVTACALAVVWALALLVLGWVARFEWVAERAGWCGSVAAHPHGSAVVGVLALAALGSCTVGGARALRRHRPAAPGVRPASGVEVRAVSVPIAHAVPGRPGHIVVSEGTLALLDEVEQRALLAHEQAHLDHGHHRFVRIGDIAAGAVPFLRPMARRVRFATERWADEDAARAVGDRTVVARAIIRVALAQSGISPLPSLALAGVGVSERVDALLNERPDQPIVAEFTLAVAVAAMLAATFASTVQFHHVLALARHVCPL